MACKVKVNRHGFLAFRFYWNGREFWQGTGWKDTARNRSKAEGKAVEITDEIKARTFNYLKWFPEGNKADEFRPKSETQADVKSLTVGATAIGSSAGNRPLCVQGFTMITFGSSAGISCRTSRIQRLLISI